jgi:hypothetical protein
MTYQDLITIIKNEELREIDIDQNYLKVLSPQPLKSPQDLELIISSKFRYLGPGKWKNVIMQSD